MSGHDDQVDFFAASYIHYSFRRVPGSKNGVDGSDIGVKFLGDVAESLFESRAGVTGLSAGVAYWSCTGLSAVCNSGGDIVATFWDYVGRWARISISYHCHEGNTRFVCFGEFRGGFQGEF